MAGKGRRSGAGVFDTSLLLGMLLLGMIIMEWKGMGVLNVYDWVMDSFGVVVRAFSHGGSVDVDVDVDVDYVLLESYLISCSVIPRDKYSAPPLALHIRTLIPTRDSQTN